MISEINLKIKDEKIKLVKTISKLDTLSPLKTLARGYSIAEYNGEILRTTKQIKENDKINVRLEDGKITATINHIM